MFTPIRLTAIITLVLAVFGVLALWLLPNPGSTGSVRFDVSDGALLAMGSNIYQAQCASCHGANLEGQPNWKSPGADGFMPAPPHDESGHTWHHPDEILFNITKLGVANAAGLTDYQSAMPIYADILTDEEIVAVLSWIKAQWPLEIQRRHDMLNKQYESERGE